MRKLDKELDRRSWKLAHIILLVLGTAFLASGAFTPVLWFDESYTVGLMNQDFLDMCEIAPYDVHPLLYYIMLKLVTMVTGNSVIVMRLFSVLGGALIGLLGYTHIRRDFGAKVGFWFSFFTFAMPVMFKYALQIRMYTWAPFFITLTAIYAYRAVYQERRWKKNWILFAVFSVASAYTHHFSLVTVIVINFLLLLYVVKHRKYFLRWLVFGAAQIVAFLPGVWVLLGQIGRGGPGWITVTYPDVLLNTLNFYFVGDTPEDAVGMSDNMYIGLTILAGVIWAFFLFLLVQRWRKNPRETKPVVLALAVALGVIVSTLIASGVVVAIYYVRYTMVLYGLIVFVFAYLMAGVSRKLVTGLVAAVFIGVTVLRVIPIYEENYDASSWCVENNIGDSMEAGDVYLVENIDGAVIGVKYPDITMYFYNSGHWDIYGAYQAYVKDMHVADSTETIAEDLADYTGKIWVLKSDALCQMVESLPGVTEVTTVSFYQEYYQLTFELVLYEKE